MKPSTVIFVLKIWVTAALLGKLLWALLHFALVHMDKFGVALIITASFIDSYFCSNFQQLEERLRAKDITPLYCMIWCTLIALADLLILYGFFLIRYFYVK